jgi:FKBP-type peptidyl-prolyl cis-trans isomerase FkpA
MNMSKYLTMQKVVLFFLAAAIIVGSVSCKNAGFRKAKGGIWYKIVKGSSDTGAFAVNGSIMKCEAVFKYKDSVLGTTVGSMPRYWQMESQSIPEPYYGIFSKMRTGDSLVLKMLVDSMPNSQSMMFAKKGEYITSYYKVLGIFADRNVAQADIKKEGDIAKAQDSIKAIAQTVTDDKAIEDYLTKNNIKTIKAPKGTYVEIIDPGTSEALDTGKTVGLFYTGKALVDGKPFDSNIDTTFHHTDTLPVNMGLSPQQGGMIAGFTDGLSILHVGAKARLYIPSALGYGARGREPKIQPNENLVFEIHVVSSKPTPKGAAGMAMGGRPGQGQMNPAMAAKIRAMQQAQAARKGQQPAQQH